jgi:hypothetical protein
MTILVFISEISSILHYSACLYIVKSILFDGLEPQWCEDCCETFYSESDVLNTSLNAFSRRKFTIHV